LYYAADITFRIFVKKSRATEPELGILPGAAGAKIKNQEPELNSV